MKLYLFIFTDANKTLLTVWALVVFWLWNNDAAMCVAHNKGTHRDPNKFIHLHLQVLLESTTAYVKL